MSYDYLIKSTGKAGFTPPARRALRDAHITTLGILACLSRAELFPALQMDEEITLQVVTHAKRAYGADLRDENTPLHERAIELYDGIENPPVGLLLFMQVIGVDDLESLEERGITNWGGYRQAYGPLFFE